MDTSLRYFDLAPRSAQDLRQRCLRVLQIVGSCWGLLGGTLQMYLLSSHPNPELAIRLRMFGICAIMIGAGIYSVVLPLHFVLRSDDASRTLSDPGPS